MLTFPKDKNLSQEKAVDSWKWSLPLRWKKDPNSKPVPLRALVSTCWFSLNYIFRSLSSLLLCFTELGTIENWAVIYRTSSHRSQNPSQAGTEGAKSWQNYREWSCLCSIRAPILVSWVCFSCIFSLMLQLLTCHEFPQPVEAHVYCFKAGEHNNRWSDKLSILFTVFFLLWAVPLRAFQPIICFQQTFPLHPLLHHQLTSCPLSLHP